MKRAVVRIPSSTAHRDRRAGSDRSESRCDWGDVGPHSRNLWHAAVFVVVMVVLALAVPAVVRGVRWVLWIAVIGLAGQWVAVVATAVELAHGIDPIKTRQLRDSASIRLLASASTSCSPPRRGCCSSGWPSDFCCCAALVPNRRADHRSVRPRSVSMFLDERADQRCSSSHSLARGLVAALRISIVASNSYLCDASCAVPGRSRSAHLPLHRRTPLNYRKLAASLGTILGPHIFAHWRTTWASVHVWHAHIAPHTRGDLRKTCYRYLLASSRAKRRRSAHLGSVIHPPNPRSDASGGHLGASSVTAKASNLAHRIGAMASE